MKRKTVKVSEMIERLQNQGHTVVFKKAKDRVVIKSIDGSKFSGNKGNTKARSILGINTTDSQQSQRKNAARLSVSIRSGYNKSLKVLEQKFGTQDDSIKTQLRKTVKAWAKYGEDFAKNNPKNVSKFEFSDKVNYGKFSAERLANNIEYEQNATGEAWYNRNETLMKKLKKSEYHVSGLASDYEVEFAADVITWLGDNPNFEGTKAIAKSWSEQLLGLKGRLTCSDCSALLQLKYNVQNGVNYASQLSNLIQQILSNYQK